MLVPSCSRKVEDGMVVRTDSERVDAQPQDGARVPGLVRRPLDHAHVDAGSTSTAPHPERYGPPAPPAAAGERDTPRPDTTTPATARRAATVAQPVKVDNELYVRDYSQVHPLLQVRGGLRHRLRRTRSRSPSPGAASTPASPPSSPPRCPTRPASTAATASRVCPTGALMFKSEYDLRQAGTLGRVARRP